ncbi:aminoglycoside adenylyltransferase domain-containing protein [Cohnella zeiphila]|uniref:Spectinomycin 9-adenylyltransferase n=1 Tax=Cohnella zeiphila TaxID=2761120 RepID=A0A7X0VVW2_9BACL|nr:aminoglycoside adenylyltransferase domain-containing protein [Cohnella zeiphila]MBB6732321.1 DUF4111 domain-containing protein [Cohnella zeiphila]
MTINLYGWDNCPAEVKDQVGKLQECLIRQLDDNLLGTYLHGSLALQCFNPACSDLDVIVLLKESIDVEVRFRLVQELLALSLNPAPIEISLITQGGIRPWRHPTPFELHCSEYWRQRYEDSVVLGDKEFWAGTPVDGDLACHIMLIRQKGICVYGLSVAEAFPDVPEPDFRSSILDGVDYAADSLRTLPVYGILTLCRVLSYLKTGRILSKRDAGIWALHLLPESLRDIVRSAVELYEGSRSDMAAMSDEDLNSYKSFMLSAIQSAA